MRYALLPPKLYGDLVHCYQQKLLEQLTEAGNDMNLVTAAIHANLDFTKRLEEEVKFFEQQN